MNDRDYLEEYLEICQAVYEQMKRDGTWPWTEDSPNSDDMVDSEDNSSIL